MDFYNGPTSGAYSRGPTDINAYNARVKYNDDLRKALDLFYGPGDPTPEQIAALGVSPDIVAEAQKQDAQTSADRASWNFSSNMMPLLFLGGAAGATALGVGAGAGTAAADAGGGLLGAAATDPAGFAALESAAAAGDATAAGTLSSMAATDPAGFAALESAASSSGAAGFTPTLGLTDPTALSMNTNILTPGMISGADTGSAGLLGSGAAAGGGSGGGAVGASSNALMPGDLAAYESGLAGQEAKAGSSLSGILGKLGDAKSLATIGGALLGGLSSGDKTASQSSTKEPWGPAQPWILQNIASGQKLQDFYQKNPFNAQQQTGLQNTLTDADNFRANVLPGLLDFANGMQTGQYTRRTGGAPGSGAGYGGAVQPGGYSRGTGGSFSAAPGNLFGQIDWTAINPFTKG